MSAIEQSNPATVDAPTIETITFKLQSEADEEKFVEAVKETEALLDRKGAKIDKRFLVSDETGQWTEVIHWQSLRQAKKMLETLMEEPEFTALLPMIDMASLSQTYSQIHWEMS